MCNILLAITISLLTCTPGQELYARYGHTAIRVQDPQHHVDWVFNYGLFSFEDKGFYWHFVQGQTWYELGVQTYQEFMQEYHLEHRPVIEQVLILNDEEKETLFRTLRVNAQPENCKYLYNFVYDNCATRPFYIIKKAVQSSLWSNYEGWDGQSYRNFIHHYTRHGSWAEFGINLLFGYKADEPVLGEKRLFLPEELMFWVQNAHRPDGSPLAYLPHNNNPQLSRTDYLLPFVIEPVPWYASWYFGLALFVVMMVVINVRDRSRERRSKWLDWTLLTLYVVMAALMVFLIFFSIHPLVSIGWRLFIIPIIHLCTRLIYFLHF